MKTSNRGIELIKQFEGLSLHAVKLLGESFYTIGYGHYGADVRADQVITEAEAEQLLRMDLMQIEDQVLKTVTFKLNQNQFDALVSFTYNCGSGNLKQLVKGRSAAQIASHMLVYTHSGSEAYTQGLINRRRKEQALFLEPVKENGAPERWQDLSDIPAGYLRDQAERLVQLGALAGDGEGLDITADMLRTILITERLILLTMHE